MVKRIDHNQKPKFYIYGTSVSDNHNLGGKTNRNRSRIALSAGPGAHITTGCDLGPRI